MTVFKIFIVAAALLFCPSLGVGNNCTRRYQRLLGEAAVVKAQCPHAALHDCCQVRRWVFVVFFLPGRCVYKKMTVLILKVK